MSVQWTRQLIPTYMRFVNVRVCALCLPLPPLLYELRLKPLPRTEDLDTTLHGAARHGSVSSTLRVADGLGLCF